MNGLPPFGFVDILLNDMKDYTLDDLAEWDDKASKAAEKYSDHVYQLKEFEALSKDFLAALKMEYRDHELKGKQSESELETRSRADERWTKFRKEELEKLREAGKYEIAYKNALRRVEVIRSALALKRTEVQRFSG